MIRDIIHWGVNRVILRRKEQFYRVFFLDEDDKMWYTLIAAYSRKYAKKRLRQELEDNSLMLTEVVYSKTFYKSLLDKDNIYASEYEED